MAKSSRHVSKSTRNGLTAPRARLYRRLVRPMRSNKGNPWRLGERVTQAGRPDRRALQGRLDRIDAALRHPVCKRSGRPELGPPTSGSEPGSPPVSSYGVGRPAVGPKRHHLATADRRGKRAISVSRGRASAHERATTTASDVRRANVQLWDRVWRTRPCWKPAFQRRRASSHWDHSRTWHGLLGGPLWPVAERSVRSGV